MTRKKSKKNRVCLWCGAEIDPLRSARSKFCNASHRALWHRRGTLVTERYEQAVKQVERVASCLALDFANEPATEALKHLMTKIEWYLENGWQGRLPGVDDDPV